MDCVSQKETRLAWTKAGLLSAASVLIGRPMLRGWADWPADVIQPAIGSGVPIVEPSFVT